jgi:hypothetical protein
VISVQKNSAAVGVAVSSFIFLDYFRWLKKRTDPSSEEKNIGGKLNSLFFQFFLPVGVTTAVLYQPVLPFFLVPLATWKIFRHGMSHVLYPKIIK